MYSGTQLNELIADDIAPDILMAKRYEEQACQVEIGLRKQFKNAKIFAISDVVSNDPEMSDIRPCIRLIHRKGSKARFNEAATKMARKLFPGLSDKGQDVHILDDDLSITSEKCGLKTATEKMLRLRYGHDHYSVEYKRSMVFPWMVDVTIGDDDFKRHYLQSGFERMSRLLDVHNKRQTVEHEEIPDVMIPEEVADYILEVSRNFRPGLKFRISRDTKLMKADPDYSPGFVPAR